ncbi:MAG: ComEC/Rec2 family competence protein [Anaerolineae bacterium]|nr:ComEC/Rec2 family competence protein [Anaerolineae bacterium]
MRLVYLASGWAFGLLLAATFPLFPPALWLITAIISAITGIFLPRGRRRWLLLAAAACALAGFRFSLIPVNTALAGLNDSGGLTLQGIVAEAPQLTENRYQFRLNVEAILQEGSSAPISGAVLVRAPLSAQVSQGERIRVTGRLISPFVADRFSYADYLQRQGMTGILTDTAIESIAPPAPGFSTALSQFRIAARNAINAALPEPSAGLLIAILFGDENGLAPPISDAFGAAGIAHVLAVSGFNMIVVASAVQATLNRLRVPRIPAAFIAIAAVLIYALLAGASVAVLRAAFMSMLLIAGTALRRKTFIPASLAFSLIVLTIIDPHALWDVGWQLSFFTVLALSQFAAPIAARLNHLVKPLPSELTIPGTLLIEPLAATLAAQVAALPIIALYFGTISLIAPITNLLVVPVQPAIMLFGILGLLTVSFVPAFAQLWFWCAGILLTWTANVARTAANLPFAEISINVSPALIALYFIVWIGWSIMSAAQPVWFQRFTTTLRSRAVYSAAAFAAICILVLMGADLRGRPDGSLHIWFLDMEGKNAVLLQTPDGAHILLDGGDMPSRLLTAIGDRLPFHDQRLEMVFATQPDIQNFGTLPDVLNRYDFDILFTNGQPNLDDTWQSLLMLAGERIQPLQAGSTIVLSDGVSIQALNPLEIPTLGDSLDDSALALQLTYGDFSILLPGDLSSDSLTRYAEEGLLTAATIIQVPHPVSERALNQQIMAALRLQAAIIQHSATNRRDDPSPQTLSFLGEIPVYSTSSGTVHLWTDGITWSVQQES